MATYSYNKSSVNHQKLKKEINTNAGITSGTCTGMTYDGTTINVETSSTFTSAEETTLSSIVSSHSGTASSNETVASNLSDSVNSTTAWVNKLTQTFVPDIAGNYKIEWSCECTNDTNGNQMYVRLQQDAVLLSVGNWAPNNGGEYNTVAGFAIVNLNVQSYSFTIDFKTVVVNRVAHIRNVYLRIIKVT